MFKIVLAFAAGYYFGRRPQATGQIIAAGGKIVDTVTGQKISTQPICIDNCGPAQNYMPSCPPGVSPWSPAGSPQCVPAGAGQDMLLSPPPAAVAPQPTIYTAAPAPTPISATLLSSLSQRMSIR